MPPTKRKGQRPAQSRKTPKPKPKIRLTVVKAIIQADWLVWSLLLFFGYRKEPREDQNMPPTKRKGQRPAQSRKTPKPKPKIRLTVVKAIIQEYLQQARKQMEAKEDGMERLIRWLRPVKPRTKKKKAG